jgi:dihydrofolate reductase
MRKIIFFMNTSLDGIIGGEDEESNTSESQNNTDTPSDEDHNYANNLFDSVDTIVFGRTTYEGFTAYWDNVDVSDSSKPVAEVEFAKIFQQKSRIVFSRTLTKVPTNTLLISKDITNQIEQIKLQDGKDLLLVCGSELFATLINLNLVDELQLILSPKAYGKGQLLFGKLDKPIKMSLLQSKTFKSGGILVHYKINKI